MNLRGIEHLIHRWILRTDELTASIPEFDLRVQVIPADSMGRRLYKYRTHEPTITDAIRTHVRFQPGDVVLDVGANLGWYSLVVDRLAQGACRTFSFEPDPRNFALLEKNVARNGITSVTPCNLAVGERPGTLTLHRHAVENTGRHSALPINDGETMEVPVTSLDAFWQERALGDAPVRLLKMDIEGYEAVALRGAREVLARCEWALIEHTPAFMRAAGLDPAETVEILTAAGFSPAYPRGKRLEPVSAAAVLRNEEQHDVLWHRPGRA